MNKTRVIVSATRNRKTSHTAKRRNMHISNRISQSRNWIANKLRKTRNQRKTKKIRRIRRVKIKLDNV